MQYVGGMSAAQILIWRHLFREAYQVSIEGTGPHAIINAAISGQHRARAALQSNEASYQPSKMKAENINAPLRNEIL